MPCVLPLRNPSAMLFYVSSSYFTSMNENHVDPGWPKYWLFGQSFNAIFCHAASQAFRKNRAEDSDESNSPAWCDGNGDQNTGSMTARDSGLADCYLGKLPTNEFLSNSGHEYSQGSWSIQPIPSKYGIFIYVWLIFVVNAGKHTIHGCNGKLMSLRWSYLLVVWNHLPGEGIQRDLGSHSNGHCVLAKKM